MPLCGTFAAGSRSMRILEPHFDVATFWTGAGSPIVATPISC